MTATDELRRLLDERGVEWSEGLGNEHRVETFFDDMNGHTALFVDFGDGNPFGGESELSADLTPAQAVEATLGRCECRNKATQPRTFWCNRCDCAVEDWLDVGGNLGRISYCPNCGRKVVGA